MLELAGWLGLLVGWMLTGAAHAQPAAASLARDAAGHPLQGLSPEAWQALHIDTDLVKPPWVVQAAGQIAVAPGVEVSGVTPPMQLPGEQQSSVDLPPRPDGPWNASSPSDAQVPAYRPLDVEPPPASTASEVIGREPSETQVVVQEAYPGLGSRPRVLFDPAVPARDPRGSSVLRPVVRLVDAPDVQLLPTTDVQSPMFAEPPAPWGGERLPSVDDFGLTKFFKPYAERPRPVWDLLCFLTSSPDRSAGYDVGVARERLPFALFEIDSTQPLNNYRLRFDSAFDWEAPDRAEYLWSSASGRGPGIYEPSVDYQDIRFLMEMGGKRMSVGTELPIRMLNPTYVGNTAGLGDITVTTKTVLLDGDTWQLTQILRTQMPTGAPSLGRGNGHTSMEPGLLARYKWSEDVLLHSELKFWFPLGGDPDFSGQYLRYGLGVADVMIDTDDFAVLRSLEVVAWSFLSGRRTVGPTPAFDVPVDGENIVNIYPGFRLVRDGVGDFGMFEIGCSSGLSLTERHFYRSLLRLDLRWSY